MFDIIFNYTLGLTKKTIISLYQKKINRLHKILHEKVNSQNIDDMVGWYDSPVTFSEFKKIELIVKKWKLLAISDVVITSIGGSYSGIKALIDMVKPNVLDRKIKFHFVNSISEKLIQNTIKNVKNNNFGLICISKSGNTLETSINFRIFRELLWKKYGKKSSERIIIITDKRENILHRISQKNSYQLFQIPSDIGGRFSSITHVCLLPGALIGINPHEIIAGAKKARADFSSDKLELNLAYLYAAFRNYMYKQMKKNVEFFNVYHNHLKGLCIQHQQLFAESEGKLKRGILPVVGNFTTDLHSVGQYLQSGKKIFFETTLLIKKNLSELLIPESSFNDDGLDNLTKISMAEINSTVAHAVLTAHSEKGQTPNLLMILEDTSERCFGYFYFFLSLAATMSALLLRVNPFDQPGVEEYKQIARKKLKMITK